MSDHDPLQTLIDWADEGRPLALATVVETWGSAPSPAGSLLVIDGTGDFRGSVSGGCVEGAVIAEAMAMLERGTGARLLDYGVSDAAAWAVGLACGGRIRILLQPVNAERRAAAAGLIAARAGGRAFLLLTALADGRILAPEALPAEARAALAARQAAGRSGLLVLPEGEAFAQVEPAPLEIVVIGAVHAAQVLARLAGAVSLPCRIVDPRSAFATPGRFPDVPLAADWPQEAFAAHPLGEGSAVVALTHDPKIDDPALIAALAAGAFHVGALGSRKTHAARLERLRAAGVAEADLARIRGPVGLPIGAEGPGEIAVAILAEIIAARRRPAALPSLREAGRAI